MIVIPSTAIWYIDVDDTLVLSEATARNMQVGDNEVEPVYFNGILFYIHLPHVQLVKELKARGHTVVVWSAGKWEWAETVVRKLGLVDYVDVVMSKPDGYCDDKDVTKWLPPEDKFYIPIGC